MSTITSRPVSTNRTIQVDYLYLTTCSRCRASDVNLDAAVGIVRPVLDAVGDGVDVRKTLVETEEQARALGFVSSPTIRVNGRDIAGDLIESSCQECGELCGSDGRVDCRVWDYRGELYTEAPTGLIVEALLAEIGQSGGARGEKTPEATSSADVSENLKLFFAGNGAASAATSCCSAEEQGSCCDPSEKAGCCGDAAGPSSCGCH